jgi:hypothetical protein
MMDGTWIPPLRRPEVTTGASVSSKVGQKRTISNTETVVDDDDDGPENRKTADEASHDSKEAGKL